MKRKGKMSVIDANICSAGPSAPERKSLRDFKELTIHVFSENVKEYESLRAAFNYCIETANAPKEERFLHLINYLSSQAPRLIESMKYGESAFDLTLQKLDS